MSNLIPITVMAQVMHDMPKCEEHGHVLDLWGSGDTPSGQKFHTKACTCVVDAFEYCNTHRFLHSAIVRLEWEKTELRDRVEELERELA